jgi:hypothetical protein
MHSSTTSHVVIEAFLHAKPLSTDWREMLSALDGGRRSPVCEPSFQDFLDSKSAHQAAGANRLPVNLAHRSASEDGKRNPYECTEVVQSRKSLVGGYSRVAFLNLVPTSP